jgi:hypothetical protein
MYPHELDVLYGDAILLKVVKKDVEEDLDTDMYEVVDMLTDPLILDKFFHCYMPSYGAFDYVGENLLHFKFMMHLLLLSVNSIAKSQ